MERLGSGIIVASPSEVRNLVKEQCSHRMHCHLSCNPLRKLIGFEEVEFSG